MKRNFSTLLILVVSLAFTSCKDDDDDPNVVQVKINNVVPEQYLQIVRGLGMETYTGDTPPDISGTYLMSPNLLLRSNIPNDAPSNSPFVNYTINFTNQNSSNFSISFTGSASGEQDSSNSAVIAGSGNDFSVYGKSTTVVGSNSVVLGVIYSGTMEGGKIKNLKRAIIVLDDSKGGPNLLKNENARVFQDGDRSS
ncbi:hypothetical protein [Algoriphagus antarcticus]|uniref:Uncharacterized protein n=1 Tax=Algoriphagus antarcticus TaxID=238540 RepID=A0A3E0DX63_9BACT|nr:hypothetical protein [Algoriphagus antarcticus]REG90687.1 hypothetical protein C8N25_106188 [Algoriphagus antarcticus]